MMGAMRYPDSPVTDTLDLILTRNTRGEVVDTLGRVRSSLGVGIPWRATEFHYHPGASDLSLSWDGGFVTGRSDEYRLLRYDRSGRLERIVSLDRERLPFTSEDRDIVLNRLELMFSGAPSSVLPEPWDAVLVLLAVSRGWRALGDDDKSYKAKLSANDASKIAEMSSFTSSYVPMQPGSVVGGALR